MSETWTVKKILDWTSTFFTEKGFESPKLEAELLLAHLLGLDRIHLYMQWDRPLTPEELAGYRALIKRRAQHEPLAYITGSRAFWKLDFACDARALIPRSDSEVLIEAALELLPKDEPTRIVDVGSGTGCLGLTLASEFPLAQVTLVDISPEALSLSDQNTTQHHLEDRVTSIRSDLLEDAPGPWDLIISNPPYIALTEKDIMGTDVLKHEPPLALFAGEDGLDIIRNLLEQAFQNLSPNGWIICEIGYQQGLAVKQLMEDLGFDQVTIRQDYAGKDRAVLGQRLLYKPTGTLNAVE